MSRFLRTTPTKLAERLREPRKYQDKRKGEKERDPSNPTPRHRHPLSTPPFHPPAVSAYLSFLGRNIPWKLARTMSRRRRWHNVPGHDSDPPLRGGEHQQQLEGVGTARLVKKSVGPLVTATGTKRKPRRMHRAELHLLTYAALHPSLSFSISRSSDFFFWCCHRIASLPGGFSPPADGGWNR